jgi:hypothetical protein
MPHQGDRNIMCSSVHTNTPKIKLSLDMSPCLIPSISTSDSRSSSTLNYSISLPSHLTPENDNAPAPKDTPQFSLDSNLPLAIYAKHKYKSVAQKVRPITTSLPDRFRIHRDISSNPLATIPTLLPNPPPFSPTGRYTQEWYNFIKKAHPTNFLWHAERALMHHFMCLQNQGFAWDDSEHGRFCDDFFPPIEMPVVDHKPWVLRNIPIPKVFMTRFAALYAGNSLQAYTSPPTHPIDLDGSA